MDDLQSLIRQAENELGPGARAALSELVQNFLEAHTSDVPFSAEELRRIRQIDRETFDEAPAEDVAALFARRG